jgi:hypothetical protein
MLLARPGRQYIVADRERDETVSVERQAKPQPMVIVATLL